MKTQIEPYLKDMETAWAPSTLKSERSRLSKVAQKLDKGPEELYLILVKTQGLYTIRTTFIRICELERWIGKSTDYHDFMRKHRNKFKHAYTKEKIDVTYQEACKAIKGLKEEDRSLAQGLLRTGVRISEAYRCTGGSVKGKGGKVRDVYGQVTGTVPRSSFSRRLREVGLKPHTLRKLFATRLVEKGATPADLCKIMGWSSIRTAYQYLQPREDKELEALVASCSEGA